MATKWISAAAACALAACCSWASAQQEAAKEAAGAPPSSEQRVAPKAGAKPERVATVEEAIFAPPEPSLDGVSFEQSAGGKALSAIAMATSDAEWAKKWAASGQPVPKLKQARLVSMGEKVQVLIVVASRPNAPTIDASSNPLLYVVDVYRPDGALQERLADNTCMKKGERMPPGNIAVCEGALVFELEPSDPKGQWVFKISMAVPGQSPLVFGTSFEAF